MRPIADDEVETMRSWRNAPDVRRNMYTQHEISEQEHIAWWDRTRYRVDQQYWMYERTGEPAGIIAFTSIDHTNRNCSWAFYAAPQALRGTGSRMEYLALDHAFTSLGVHKLYCEVLSHNVPVIGLHQKFGFHVEGILREQYRIRGSFVDSHRLGLLSSEWTANRKELFDRVFRMK